MHPFFIYMIQKKTSSKSNLMNGCKLQAFVQLYSILPYVIKACVHKRKLCFVNIATHTTALYLATRDVHYKIKLSIERVVLKFAL